MCRFPSGQTESNTIIDSWTNIKFHGFLQATPYMIGQERFCRVLREHLKNSNVEVEFSSELLSSEQRNDDVISIIKTENQTESVESLFVVGADGARGVLSPCFIWLPHIGTATTSLTCSWAYKALYADNWASSSSERAKMTLSWLLETSK